MNSEINFDWDRAKRIGIGEAVFCQGKTFSQLQTIVDQLRQRDASCLLTRLDADSAAKISGLNYDSMSRTAFVGRVNLPSSPAQVCIVTAGSSDAAAAREVARTLEFHGQSSNLIFDVGVAGLHRLMARLPEIAAYRIVIVVAGMDAALASVVAGQVPGMVIGLPTSTGYGVARGGETALNAMLASCAAGLAVVNIDNGFGAACIALRALS